jgi:hypothetical protein
MFTRFIAQALHYVFIVVHLVLDSVCDHVRTCGAIIQPNTAHVPAIIAVMVYLKPTGERKAGIGRQVKVVYLVKEPVHC